MPLSIDGGQAQRTVAILTERLDKHRGAGQQSITVKHVTVNADNAIVGDVNQAPGGGPPVEIKGQPHALGHAIQPALWSENQEREAVPIAGDEKREMQDARRPFPGAPKGNKNALKHGLYTAEAIAMRRLLQASDRERCVRFRDDRAPALFSERGQVATATTARLSRQYRGVVARGVGMGSRLKADGQMPVRQLDEAPKL